MITSSRGSQSLSRPWDLILGTRSNVRTLRVLERDREPMTVREIARRAEEHLRAAQTAVSRLVEVGLIERIGTGSHQLVRWNASHPLAQPLSDMFRAERERQLRIIETIARLAQEHASGARFVWMTEHADVGGPRIEIGVLASSSDVDRLVTAVRAAVVSLMQSEDLLIEVRGWTSADLDLTPRLLADDIRHLWGVPPAENGPQNSRKSRKTRSHRTIDEEMSGRASRLASAVRSRPELVRMAREEIATRLQNVRPQEAQTLQEWQQVLEGMSVPRLARWLVSDGEQAVRLRQSMPFTFLEATESDPDGTRGGRS